MPKTEKFFLKLFTSNNLLNKENIVYLDRGEIFTNNVFSKDLLDYTNDDLEKKENDSKIVEIDENITTSDQDLKKKFTYKESRKTLTAPEHIFTTKNKYLKYNLDSLSYINNPKILKNTQNIDEEKNLSSKLITNMDLQFTYQKDRNYLNTNSKQSLKTQVQINLLENENTFINLLKNKLSKLDINTSIDSLGNELFKKSLDLMNIILDKLYLKSNLDLEKLFFQHFVKNLDKCYTQGKILFFIHPTQEKYISDLLETKLLQNKYKENIKIVTDINLKEKDCYLQYNDSYINYNYQELKSQVQNFIKEFKDLV